MTSYLIGHFSVDGIVKRADNLAGKLHICLDNGAKKVLLPQTSAVDLGKVLAEFMNSYCLLFFQSAEDIDQQRDLAEEYAAAHGLTIVKEYVDEALSGRDDTRPQYQLMLYEVKTLKPAVLILWKTDRLGRDRYDLIIAKKIIRDAGCQIECVAEPFLDPNDPTSIFIEGMLDAQAEYYSASLKKNVMRGLNYNAKSCYYNGIKVFGYATEELPIKAKGGGYKKVYVLDPVTSPVVRRIFEDYANGKPLKEIIDD